MKARPVKKSFRNLSERDAKRLALVLSGILFLVIILLALFPLLDRVNQKHEATTYSMNSYVQQTVYGKDGESAAVQAANAVQVLENKISWRVTDSEILELNSHAGTDWISLSEETLALLAVAQDVAAHSGGAFDVTIAPVSRLWDFDGDRCEVPDTELLTEAVSHVDYTALRVDAETGTTSLKYYNSAVDLGAIGKGAACDAAVRIYAAHDVSAAIVAVGSSVGLYGEKPSGQLWNLAVQDPADRSTALGTLSLANGFVSTASSYEKYFEENGVLYHHLLDPATGYPAESGLVSVTVVSDGGVLSDALAAACFVLGPEESLSLLQHYGAEGIFIDTNGVISVTDGLRDAFELTAESYTLAK